MVPQLVGAAAAELSDLRQAVFAAASARPGRWLAVGVGPTDAVVARTAASTCAGYGVDIRVGLSPGADDLRDLPLSALITGWLRAEVKPGARAEVRVFAGGHSGPDAIRRGEQLRSDIDHADEPVGVLVVADGANTLTQPAPGGHDP